MNSKEMDHQKQMQWQKRLLPVMIGVLVVLTLFFFIASFVQLYHLNRQIEQSPQLDLNPTLSSLESTEGNIADNYKLDYVQWKTLALLEGHALQRRYHQTNVALMARIWRRYLGFVTGMILSLVGAAFILGRLREPKSTLDAESSMWKFSITTASPGLILALLGTILMITTILAHPKIEVVDRPVYLEQKSDGPRIDTVRLLDELRMKLKTPDTAPKDKDINKLLDDIEKKIKEPKKNKQ